MLIYLNNLAVGQLEMKDDLRNNQLHKIFISQLSMIH